MRPTNVPTKFDRVGADKWYPATVRSQNDDGTYNVEYDDGYFEDSCCKAPQGRRAASFLVTSAVRRDQLGLTERGAPYNDRVSTQRRQDSRWNLASRPSLDGVDATSPNPKPRDF